MGGGRRGAANLSIEIAQVPAFPRRPAHVEHLTSNAIGLVLRYCS